MSTSDRPPAVHPDHDRGLPFDVSTLLARRAALGVGSATGDRVFGDDGGIHQLATVTGDAGSGFVANLTVAV